MLAEEQIGFLGFGNMAGAIARGVVAAGVVDASHIHIFDVVEAKGGEAKAAGFQVAESAAALAQAVSVLILAPKPQDMAAALDSIRPTATPQTLIVSIAAGISTAYIEKTLGHTFRVVRVMPNTPALVSAGAAGVAAGAACAPGDVDLVLELFRAVGIAEPCDESHIDAVTAVSGSGPAYFFYFVECLADAGVAAGLPQDLAVKLAIETLFGAGALLKDSGESPAVLRERVTSKGGTTFAALQHFRANDFEKIVREAVEAAAARSRELGQ